MQRFSRNGLALIIALAVAVVGLTIAALIPSSRLAIREYFLKTDRVVLAKANGLISQQGPNVTVIKLRNQNSIGIEIYTIGDDGKTTLLQKENLQETHDGYFNFMGNATNLALGDTDHNGILNILVPTFDDQMNPRLHVFRFNRDLNHFEHVVAPGDQEHL